MKKWAVMLACTAVLMSGCMESTVTNPTTQAENGQTETMTIPTPDMEIHDDIELDWEQGIADVDDVLRNANYYPDMTDVSVLVDTELDEISIVISVKDDMDKETAVDYAQRALEDTNNAVADQDFSIAKAEEGVTYGGLYERYAVSVGVAPESTVEDESTWLVHERLEKGEGYRPLQATE
ncbi:MAG: hypothetical protein Q4D90_01195 [bacterium]|nr:hypothetical protein [bacterium]